MLELFVRSENVIVYADKPEMIDDLKEKNRKCCKSNPRIQPHRMFAKFLFFKNLCRYKNIKIFKMSNYKRQIIQNP